MQELLNKKPLYKKLEEDANQQMEEEQQEKIKQLDKKMKTKERYKPMTQQEQESHWEKFEINKKRRQDEFENQLEQRLKERGKNEEWLQQLKEKYPKHNQNPEDVGSIDYYEIEAKVEMLKDKFKRDRGKEYLDRMQQFNHYVKDQFLPKQSKKKQAELERAFQEKKCSFAKYSPHIGIDAMLINDSNFPISPKFTKTRNEDINIQLKKNKSYSLNYGGKRSGKTLNAAEDHEEKLAIAVPGYEKARKNS